MSYVMQFYATNQLFSALTIKYDKLGYMRDKCEESHPRRPDSHLLAFIHLHRIDRK